MIDVLDLAEYILYIFAKHDEKLNVLFLSKIISLIQEHFINKDIMIIKENPTISNIGFRIDKVWYGYLVKSTKITNSKMSRDKMKDNYSNYEKYMKNKYGNRIVEELKCIIIKYLKLGSFKTNQIFYNNSKLYKEFKDKSLGTKINISELLKKGK